MALRREFSIRLGIRRTWRFSPSSSRETALAPSPEGAPAEETGVSACRSMGASTAARTTSGTAAAAIHSCHRFHKGVGWGRTSCVATGRLCSSGSWVAGGVSCSWRMAGESSSSSASSGSSGKLGGCGLYSAPWNSSMERNRLPGLSRSPFSKAASCPGGMGTPSLLGGTSPSAVILSRAWGGAFPVRQK